jgi:hypothetical protein
LIVLENGTAVVEEGVFELGSKLLIVRRLALYGERIQGNEVVDGWSIFPYRGHLTACLDCFLCECGTVSQGLGGQAFQAAMLGNHRLLVFEQFFEVLSQDLPQLVVPHS